VESEPEQGKGGTMNRADRSELRASSAKFVNDAIGGRATAIFNGSQAAEFILAPPSLGSIPDVPLTDEDETYLQDEDESWEIPQGHRGQ